MVHQPTDRDAYLWFSKLGTPVSWGNIPGWCWRVTTPSGTLQIYRKPWIVGPSTNGHERHTNYKGADPTPRIGWLTV